MSKHNKHKNHASNTFDNKNVVTEVADISNTEIDVDNVVEETDTVEIDTDLVETTTVESVETLRVDADNNDGTESDDISEDVDTSVVIEPQTVEPEIVKPEVVVAPAQVVNFYKVGTDITSSSCINQVIATTDFAVAKQTCIDARNASNKTYHVFDNSGNAVYSAEYSCPRDNYYRVGTEWKNGKCVNQKLFTADRDKACDAANDNTKIDGVVYSVYDPSGKVVFTAKKKLILLSYKKRGTKNVDWYS